MCAASTSHKLQCLNPLTSLTQVANLTSYMLHKSQAKNLQSANRFHPRVERKGLLSGWLFKDSVKATRLKFNFSRWGCIYQIGAWWLEHWDISSGIQRERSRSDFNELVILCSLAQVWMCQEAARFIFTLPVSPTQSVDGFCKIDVFSSCCESLWVMIDFDGSLRVDSIRLFK